MKEAYIPRVTEGLEIDWENIPKIPIDLLVMTASTEVKAFARICYSDSALFLQLAASESEIRAVETDLLGQPCQDSCLEFFFCPMEGDNRYFNMEFNPNTCLFLGFGSGIQNLTRLIPQDSDWVNSLFHPVVTRQTDGWNITYQIPYQFIRRFFPNFKAAPGHTIRANFYKCADLASSPHYLSWNPITGTEGSVFHAPHDFGLLRFA